MSDFFITSTGKKILFERNLKWSLINCFKEKSVARKIKRHNLIHDRFNNHTPSIGEVENAIAQQLPYNILDTIHDHKWFAINRDEDISKDVWESTCNHVSIKIPECVWDSFDETQEDSTYGQRAIARKFKMSNQENSDIIFMTTFKFWLIFFKIKDGKIMFCTLSNSRNYLDHQENQTENQRKRQLMIYNKYFSISHEDKQIVHTAKVRASNQWSSSTKITLL
jgi:hypothetical protein